MSQEKKKSFLDESIKRIITALEEFVCFVDTDPEDRKNLAAFLDTVRGELVQSFKNGIEVGRKRPSRTKKQEARNQGQTRGLHPKYGWGASKKS